MALIAAALLLLLWCAPPKTYAASSPPWPFFRGHDSGNVDSLRRQVGHAREAHGKLMEFMAENDLIWSATPALQGAMLSLSRHLRPVDDAPPLNLSASDTRDLGGVHANGRDAQDLERTPGDFWTHVILRKVQANSRSNWNTSLPQETFEPRPSLDEVKSRILPLDNAHGSTGNSASSSSNASEAGVTTETGGTSHADVDAIDEELTEDDLSYIEKNALELIRSDELHPLVKNITKMDNATGTCLEEKCPSALLFCILSDDCMKWGGSLSDKCHFYASDVCGEECPKEFVDIWACFHDLCKTRSEVDDDRVPAVKYLVENGDGLTAEEVEAIHKIRNAALLRRNQTEGVRRNFGGGYSDDSTAFTSKGHTVSWMTPTFEEMYPALYSKLIDFGIRANVSAGWNVPANRTGHGFQVRCMEFLEYKVDALTGEGDSLGWHTDHGSLMTLLVMLSDPDDYSGGVLQHEQRCRVVSSPLKKGDVAVYRAYQRHRVSPVIRGHRKVMVIEWWPWPKVSDADRPGPPRKKLPDDTKNVTTLLEQLTGARAAYENLTSVLLNKESGVHVIGALNETSKCRSLGPHCIASGSPTPTNETNVFATSELSFVLANMAKSLLPSNLTGLVGKHEIGDADQLATAYASAIAAHGQRSAAMRSLPVPVQQTIDLVEASMPTHAADLLQIVTANAPALSAWEQRLRADAELKAAKASVLVAEQAIAALNASRMALFDLKNGTVNTTTSTNAVLQLDGVVRTLVRLADHAVEQLNSTIGEAPFLPNDYLDALYRLNHTERLAMEPASGSVEAQRDVTAAAAVDASLMAEQMAIRDDAILLESFRRTNTERCEDDEVALGRIARASGLPGNSCAAVHGTKYCDMIALREVCPVACGVCEPETVDHVPVNIEVTPRGEAP